MKKTIHQLRLDGNKIKIQHFRWPRVFNDVHTDMLAEKKFREHKKGCDMNGRGGKTVITLTTPNGKTVTASSVCSLRDNFNRKLGVRIALSRAFYMLDNNMQVKTDAIPTGRRYASVDELIAGEAKQEA